MTTIAIFLPLMFGCSDKQQEQSHVYATSVAKGTQQSWGKVAKPIEILISNEVAGLSNITVRTSPSTASPEEIEAFTDASFTNHNSKSFIATNKECITEDTTATIKACWPAPLVPGKEECTYSAPFTEHLYGVEKERLCDSITRKENAFVSIVEMKSSMALLQISIESDKIHDILNSINIYSDRLAVAGNYKPYTGEWSETTIKGSIDIQDGDCLLNNNRLHNIYLIPDTEEKEVQITTTINGQPYNTKVKLSPMEAGSMIRLNFTKANDNLVITGSWISTSRPLNAATNPIPIEVKQGHFLRNDGYISTTLDSLCIAVVTETDGQHGKAVAINDIPEECVLCNYPINGIKLYPTIEGKLTEGMINPKSSEAEEGYRLLYTGDIKYNQDMAFSDNDGASTSWQLNHQYVYKKEDKQDEEPQLSVIDYIKSSPGAYLPSLGEMSKLYIQYNPLRGEPNIQQAITPPSGTYLTSTARNNKNLYTIDFTHGTIASGTSTQYGKGKVRLFYLF